MEKHIVGIWTPNAEVLCPACHHGETGSEEIELHEFAGVTFCDKCHRDIQVPSNVAKEHNLMTSLQELGIKASMEQTGGLCSAVYIAPSDELRTKGGEAAVDEILVTYTDGSFVLGAYFGCDCALVDWNELFFKSAEELLGWFKEHRELFATDEEAVKAEAHRIAQAWIANEEKLGGGEAIWIHIENMNEAAERLGMEYDDLESYVYEAIDEIEGGVE